MIQQLWDFSLGVALKSRQNLITAVFYIRLSSTRKIVLIIFYTFYTISGLRSTVGATL